MFLARLKHSLLASAVLLGSLCGTAAAQTETDTKVLSSAILPKDTYLYISMPSVESFKEAMTASSAGRLWADPAMDAFKEEMKGAFSSEMDEAFTKIQENLGLSVEELMNIPTGEVALAISKAPPNKLGALLIFDYGDHESQVQALLEKASGALSGVEQLESANVEHDGTEIIMYNVKAPIAKQTPLAKEFGWFLKDQRLVISNSSNLLKLTLDNWDGASEKSLETNSVYSYIMEKCESEEGTALMKTYFDPIGLISALQSTGSLGPAGAQAGIAIGFLPVLGLNQFKGVGSVAEIGDDKFEGVSRSFAYCEQPPMALMQVFQLAPVEAKPPAWVKENASVWAATHWKIDEAYTAIVSLIDGFQGEGFTEGQVDDLASQGPGIHIKNDIVDQMTGVIQVSMAPPEGEDNETDDILIALGVKDTEAFSAVLAKMMESGFPGETRELEGATVYEVSQPGVKLAITVANGQLLVGIGGAQLEQAVRNADDVRPLSETEDFQAVSQYFAENAVAVTFSRPAEQYRSLYEKLQSGEGADMFPGADDFFARMDFSKLPAFEVIEKYMAPSGGSWVGDENGVFMEGFSLHPEK
jgi:hypothetical protein